MWWIVLAALPAGLVMAFVLAVHRQVQRGRRRASAEDVGAWLRMVLRENAPGSVLIAEPNGREGFVQFALTGGTRERRILEFGLPNMAWSHPSIPKIQRLLDAGNVPWHVEDGHPPAAVQRFLRARIQGPQNDVQQRAGALIPRIAAALGHPPDQTYRVSLQGGESPAYLHELANHVENLPTRGRMERAVIKTLAASIRQQARRSS